MNRTLTVLLLCCAGAFGNATAVAGTFGTVGVYDAATNANTVDNYTGGVAEYTTFTTDVANAFAADTGGVVNFLAGIGTTANPTSVSANFSFDYGTSASKTLAVTSTDGLHIYNNNVANQVTAISDTQVFLTDSNRAFSLTFGSIAGGATNERVTEVGFTVLSRNTTNANIQTTAHYSDGTNSSINNVAISSVKGSQDTFFRFAAPAGHFISSMDFDNTGSGNDLQRRLPIDDFGIITGISLVQAGTFISTGVYNADSANNAVDTDPGGTLASFTSAVATAHSNNLGGVTDFETGFTNSGSNTHIGTTFDVVYGTDRTKKLSFTSSDGMHVWHNNTAGQVDTISDPNNLLPDSDVASTLTLGPITGGQPFERVTEVAFTALSRSTYSTGGIIDATAHFSGGGSQNTVSTVSNVAGADDTFFHFVAPAGESITSLDIANTSGLGTTGQRRVAIDDLAFIMDVPNLAVQTVSTSDAVGASTVGTSNGDYLGIVSQASPLRVVGSATNLVEGTYLPTGFAYQVGDIAGLDIDGPGVTNNTYDYTMSMPANGDATLGFTNIKFEGEAFEADTDNLETDGNGTDEIRWELFLNATGAGAPVDTFVLTEDFSQELNVDLFSFGASGVTDVLVRFSVSTYDGGAEWFATRGTLSADYAIIPEPSAFVLIALGLPSLLARRRRRRR